MEIWCETTKIFSLFCCCFSFSFSLLSVCSFAPSSGCVIVASSTAGRRCVQRGGAWEAVTVHKLSFSQRIKFHQCVPIIFIFSIIICENEIWHKMSNSISISSSSWTTVNCKQSNGALTKPCWLSAARGWGGGGLDRRQKLWVGPCKYLRWKPN